jgi:Fe2+ or Zn2+ uptake regulation protein
MNVQHLVRRLRADGHKLTPQRLAIIEALAANRTHPTAYEIYAEVRERYPMMGLATVYKTLDLLKSLGEVVETGFGAGGARYEPNLHPHLNLVCRVCGRVVDVALDAGNRGQGTGDREEKAEGRRQKAEPGGQRETPLTWVSDLAAQVGFTIQGGHIEYFGVCAACHRENSV